MKHFDCYPSIASPGKVAALALLCCIASRSFAQSAITVGDAVIDPPTVSTLGFSVPIVGGDQNHNATAAVSYRVLGAAVWSTGLPLFRVRPETISNETPPGNSGLPEPGEQFAGSVLMLAPATEYEVRIDVNDSDGGSRIQTVRARTRAVPRTTPVTPRTINVATAAALRSALQNAVAGDVITLASGTYSGRFDVINRDGTQDNPIIIRGTDRSSTIIDGTGQTYAVFVSGSDYVHIENLKIAGVRGQLNYALYLGNGQGLTARELVIDSDDGIMARDESSGPNRNFYICDNEMLGPVTWPQIAVGATTTLKNYVGIAIRGQGHTVCHNTLAGFGSSIWIGPAQTTQHTLAMDIHNNDIQRSADDAIELDGSLRNMRVWENRVRNQLMGISFQPVWGGPAYVFRNLIYNSAAAPFKLNNDPSGILLFHNTAFRYRENDLTGPYDGNAWPQLGEPANYAANLSIRNNILVGNDDALFLRQQMSLLDLNYNGYWPNGAFAIQIGGALASYATLAAFGAGTGFEANGVALTQPIFANAPPAAADYKPVGPALDFALHGQSNGIDRGVVLPNINDGFMGAAPDLGAVERGAPATVYGVRSGGAVRPAPPTSLTAN